MSKKTLHLALLAAGILILAYTAYKDFGCGRILSCDLRNRVVGSRLIQDGRLPYFYKWEKADGVRYYDPKNFDTLAVSNITASPLFLQLLEPLAGLPEWKINWWWCGIQYLMLLIMVGIAVSLAGTENGKWTVFVFTVSFLLTDAWGMNIQNGQNYLCIPFLAMVIYFILAKRKKGGWALLAGTASIVLVLVRPNALLIFIPFVFLLKNFSRSWLLAFFIPILLVAGWTVGDKRERSLWLDYQVSLTEQIKYHQELHPVVRQNEDFPRLPEWEGINNEEQHAFEENNPLHLHGETGNFFNLVRLLFHWKMPVNVLLFSCLAIILSLTGVYYYRNRRKESVDLQTAALFGYGLYLISDFFSPVFRNTYYSVQLLFPLLLAANIRTPAVKWIHGLLFAGILLNISHIPFIKMQHTIGEYLIVVVSIVPAFAYQIKGESPEKGPI